ncbi:hypothetical protein [Polluticoccus soli]|uniref:hypothetical protein n=1 Tax=Polluticoccus soli TaxID=3034150 RepID=UPI0023E109AD|nr:hypothetical protein [Flavipsychrobacter sp. JY13-12]
MKKDLGKGVAFALIYVSLILLLTRWNFKIIEALAIINLVIMSFTLLARRNIRFKAYFTSNYNFFTSKVRHKKEFDLPKYILFDKMAEVLTEAGFNVRYADKSTGTLFATSRMTLYSWGENIYIDLTEVDGLTKLDFCSACIFGFVSYGKNEKNYDRLMNTFEESLTI